MSDEEQVEENYDSDDSQEDVENPKLIIGDAIQLNDDDELSFGNAGGLNDSDSEEESEQNKDLNEDSSEEEGERNLSNSESVSDDEDDTNADENYLKKFDKDIISNYIDIYHPESRTHNYDEVRALSSVVRDTDGVVIDELHKTLPFLTKFEKAKVLGLRGKQINDGAQPFVKTPANIVSGYTIAQIELAEKKIPFIIRRPIPNGGSEYWKLSDLELII